MQQRMLGLRALERKGRVSNGVIRTYQAEGQGEESVLEHKGMMPVWLLLPSRVEPAYIIIQL